MPDFNKLKDFLMAGSKKIGDTLDKSNQFFEDSKEAALSGVREEQAAEAVAQGKDPAEALAKIRANEDLAMQGGMMVGAIKPVTKVFGSPEAMGLARARKAMQPVLNQTEIARKGSKILVEPVIEAGERIGKTQTLNPYEGADHLRAILEKLKK